jgi:hypothetical protein
LSIPPGRTDHVVTAAGAERTRFQIPEPSRLELEVSQGRAREVGVGCRIVRDWVGANAVQTVRVREAFALLGRIPTRIRIERISALDCRDGADLSAADDLVDHAALVGELLPFSEGQELLKR